MIGESLGEGGIPTHTLALSRALSGRGHDVRTIRSSTLTPVAATIRYLTRLADSVDIVHVQGLADLPALTASRLAAPLWARGSLAVAHGSGNSYWRKSGLNFAIRRSAVRGFDMVVSVSDYLEKKLERLLGDAPMHRTIYNGVDTQFFKPGPNAEQARKRIGLEGSFMLLYVGRLSPEKGPDTLISSLPSIRREIPNVRAVLCGKGKLKRQLVAQSRQLGVDGVVDFRGSVPHEQLLPYYDAADIVVVPSREEALGIVCLEAMSMMKPLVAANVGGIPEVVTDNETGILVTSDASNLAKAVIGLHADPETGFRIGKNGRRTVEERFTWERVATEFETAYRLVL
jgi:phosphatidyl-myo-inositol dimannoside synthase